ncbi:MAG: patatin-like phospholipase family protein [Calditrichia bacterium]|nr:patatin-like phospholipase family protein [Calditrichota bacterium]MCB9067198.1 patatin-like phospholipase family protein [Calditrichia bacterium]
MTKNNNLEWAKMMKRLKEIFSRREKKRLAPTVGLALGGGGVRGLAHAGILSVLEKENIPLHAIAGSSMGAIIAAAYTLNPGYSKESLTGLMLELNAVVPKRLKSPGPEEPSLLNRFRQFINLERFILTTISGWGVFPEQLVIEALNKITLEKNLQDARIPIAAVATDLISGEEVVFKEGPATIALQASSALPGFFPPVHLDGRLLVDGAIVDVVPVDVVHQMGANIVIAVDVDQEEVKPEVRNGMEAFLRSVELCSRHHKQHYLKKADLIIRPDFGQPVQTFDVTKSQLCIEAGVQAAEQALPDIWKLLNS